MLEKYGPKKMLTLAHTAYSGTDGAVTTLKDAFEFTVPDGLAWVIPGTFKMIAKLYSAGPVALTDAAEIYFGFKTPLDTRRTIPIGGRVLYQPWSELTTAQQRDADNADSVTIDLGKPLIALSQDEIFVVSVYSTVAIDVSECEFSIPYAESRPDLIIQELAYRKTWWAH